MHPTLLDFNLFGFTIHISSYRFFMLLAIVIVVAGSFWIIKKSDLNLRKSLIVLGLAIVAFLVGARLLNILINLGLYIENPARIWSLNATGFSEYGGIVTAVIIGWLVAKRLGLDIWKLGDRLAPNLGIGIAIMRVGCYLNGCCFGVETNLPWGVKFPMLSDAHLYQLSEGKATILSSAPVHPTEIYELIAALIGTAIAIVILKKKMHNGVAILAFAIWFTTFRFFNHFIRVMPNSFDAPVWFYPVFYLMLIATSSFLLYKRLENQDPDVSACRSPLN